jgi:hypothetical protein
MSIEIKHRYSGAVLHCSSQVSVKAAVAEAIRSGSNLRYSDLSGSDLSRSNLSGSNLSDSNLSGSDLSRSNLSGSNLSGTICLAVTGLPSDMAILTPQPAGWHLRIGCWQGSIAALRTLIAKDAEWPEARGDDIVARRPMLAALADMCDAWIATKADVLQQIQDRWATPGTEPS